MLTILCAVATAFFYYNATEYNQENIWFMFYGCLFMTIFMFGCELAFYLLRRNERKREAELQDRVDSVVFKKPRYEAWGTSFPARRD